VGDVYELFSLGIPKEKKKKCSNLGSAQDTPYHPSERPGTRGTFV